jgi:hypothetical protein
MASDINPNNIDGSYPVAGQDNNSQGFRDNFTNIKQNFQYAEDEINDLQTKSVLKAALVGTTLDNNMGDNLIYAALIRDFSASRVQVTPAGTPLTATLNYASGHYQTFSTTASTTLAFTNFPAAGTYGYFRVQIQITNIAHTITIPASVSLGLSGIQGISPGTSGVSNTISFGATGYYEFAFSTSDGGATITLFDLNRALTNFTAADIQTDDITATGFVSAAGNVVAGNLITSGFSSATGNVTGGNVITTGLVTATGNVRGGNITTAGTVSSTGNVNGVNLNGFIRPTAGGTTSTTAPLIFTSGSLVNAPTQSLAGGSMEYDGASVYVAPTANQRGVVPAMHYRITTSQLTLTNGATAQDVFDSPADITLPAATAYFLEAMYLIAPGANMNAVTMSTLFDVVSGSLTDISYVATSSVGVQTAVGSTTTRLVLVPTSSVVTAAAAGGDASNFTVQLRGVIRTLAATVLTPQLAFSGTPGSTTVVLRPSSYIRLTPMGTSSATSVGYWI